MQAAGTVKPRTKTKLLSCEPREDGLSLAWSDGHRSFFHSVWLRDCCYCDSCGDSYSSKRFIVPSDIPLEVEIETAAISAEGLLRITWRQDAHVSNYDPDWLRRHCYDEASRQARFHRPILWDRNLGEAIPAVLFDQASSDDHERLELYRRLRDYGFVVVREGPAVAGGIASVAGLIGELGDSAYSQIFDLTPSSRVKTMGNTQRPVPPHTDEAFRYSPPGINILGCVRAASDGGDSVLVDGFAVAAKLRQSNPQMFDLLCRYEQNFNRVHPGSLDQRNRQRMIECDDRGEIVGIRFHTRAAGPLDLPAEVVKSYYAAHHEFCRLMLAEENQLRFRLQAGESVLFDNHRVLHSRTGFQDPERFLQICNVTREDFHQRLRLLAVRLGYDDEAGMVLASGVC